MTEQNNDRRMTPATLTALSSELLEIAREHEITGHSGEVMQKAAAILEQVAGVDAVPVAAQSRFKIQSVTEWGACSVEHHQSVQANPSEWPDYETRALYDIEAITAVQVRARMAGLEEAAAWIDKRREDFDSEHGHVDPDTGTLEFGSGPSARAKEEYSGELAEIAEGIRALAALTAQSGEGVALLDELRNIANAKPEQWDPEMRGQFREWAQNRARAAIAAYEAKRGGVR